MIRLIVLSLLQSFFLAGGQVFLKMGLEKSGDFQWKWSFFRSQLTNWPFLWCGISFVIATVLWMYILKKYPFSLAYPLTCICYIFGTLAAIFVFHENVSIVQWIGVILIMAGCALIVR
ncbi:MAG: EamA family transporter [Bacteroidales bacterium]|nr:EamA family transporter [Bacteroidales bacterium]